jgi:ribose-phosphate pyrophosphokinase
MFSHSLKVLIAVMPYFPYSRQSKKKSHRGAITARMLANLLSVAGVNHVITVDLHASQMQGFFSQPVDNLHAEPLIARWIRHHVPNWQEAVVVSKNAGGTKRVTSLADALKLNFGIVTTDKRRGSGILTGTATHEGSVDLGREAERQNESDVEEPHTNDIQSESVARADYSQSSNSSRHPAVIRTINAPSPLSRATRADSISPPASVCLSRPQTGPTAPTIPNGDEADDETSEYTDERAREVITGRLIQGHIVPDDYPSPSISAMSNSTSFPGLSSSAENNPVSTTITSFLAPEHALGGTYDAAASDEEEEAGLKDPQIEHMITLVGDVRGRTVFIMDDMIDKPGSWIAAAETVVKRGGAKKVYCIATHGLFGGDCLDEMSQCGCIDYVGTHLPG